MYKFNYESGSTYSNMVANNFLQIHGYTVDKNDGDKVLDRLAKEHGIESLADNAITSTEPGSYEKLYAYFDKENELLAGLQFAVSSNDDLYLPE